MAAALWVTVAAGVILVSIDLPAQVLGPLICGTLGPGAPVSGVVMHANGTPVPNLIVQLQHPQIGPSTPVSTNLDGAYYFACIPKNVNGAYTLQVRWGSQIVFQAYLPQLGPQQAIVLP